MTASAGPPGWDELLLRLRRIEAQAREVEHVVERGNPSPEVLAELVAACAALGDVGRGLVEARGREGHG